MFSFSPSPLSYIVWPVLKLIIITGTPSTKSREILHSSDPRFVADEGDQIAAMVDILSKIDEWRKEVCNFIWDKFKSIFHNHVTVYDALRPLLRPTTTGHASSVYDD